MSSKATSKALSEEKASRMGLAWGYGVGVVQGKDVTSALNAPTNVIAILMGKDSSRYLPDQQMEGQDQLRRAI